VGFLLSDKAAKRGKADALQGLATKYDGKKTRQAVKFIS
jgi:hypothetical protein